jgi:hypothetical protein
MADYKASAKFKCGLSGDTASGFSLPKAAFIDIDTTTPRTAPVFLPVMVYYLVLRNVELRRRRRNIHRCYLAT